MMPKAYRTKENRAEWKLQDSTWTKIGISVVFLLFVVSGSDPKTAESNQACPETISPSQSNQ